ncbi:Acetylornithine aminotransferase [groundwater metagenome]|uniref:Acetylornithine aminotransferase n=2 Tax=groundwater metagenome TaxID=717931 RepID=A0A098EBE0_9ZZZZ
MENFKDKEIIEKEAKFYTHTFSRLPVVIERGKGMYLRDVNGTKYLDMFAGIGVNSVGHCNKEVVKAIKKQSGILMHTSNWLYTIPQIELAEKLTKISGMDKVFFTNDGTEAVEAAIKLVRRGKKKEIIAMEHDFHGRTLGSLSLTWKENFRKPFEPLIPFTKFAEYNNIGALEKAITENTTAVILEPIQSESGTIIPDKGYLKAVRQLCDEKGIYMVVDEVAVGFGRTGKMFCFQHENIMPDVITVAKAMGGGFPVGAMLCRGIDFNQGEHGGTYIGNPLACAAANASIDYITDNNLPENARITGEYLIKNLNELKGKNLKIKEIRGKGLLIGIDVEDAKKTVMELIENKIMAIWTGNTVRLLPPLIISKKECDKFLDALNKCKSLKK